MPSLELEAVQKKWDKVVDALERRNAADYRHISRLDLIAAGPEGLKLAGPDTAVEAMQDRHRLGRLREAAEEVLGQLVEFEFVRRGPARRADSGADATVGKFANHPAIIKVKELFDGVMVDCQVNSLLAAVSSAADGESEETGEEEDTTSGEPAEDTTKPSVETQVEAKASPNARPPTATPAGGKESDWAYSLDSPDEMYMMDETIDDLIDLGGEMR